MAKDGPSDPIHLNGQWVSSAVDRYERPLVLYATRLTGDAERARDAVQETFLRLCKQHRAEVEPHLAEWLYGVCRQRALDIRRKEKRMQPLTRIQTDARPAREPSPPEALERKESASRVLALLEELPGKQQETIRLKFRHGLSYKQIARVTGLSVTNVGFLIHTGLKTVRERLAEAPLKA